jgi:hypothetical protein
LAESELSNKLYEITGYYCDDFSYPVKEIGNIYQVWSDDSKFHDHYGVSLVIFNNKDSEKTVQANGELYDLVNEMNLKQIHFTDLYGNKSELTESKKEYFTDKYIAILKPLNLIALSFVEEKDNAIIKYKLTEFNKNDILNNLFWNCFLRFYLILDNNDIVLIFKERSNNFSDSYVILMHNDLWIGIDAIHKAMPNKYISICKYPQEFMKRSYLKNSVSDFIAYSSCIIQNKIDQGKSINDLEKDFRFLLKIYRNAFGVMEVPSSKFFDLYTNSIY